MAKEIVNEIKLHHEFDFHENIIRFYGITTENQSNNSKKYLLVMEYANNAFQLANAISFLHDEGIVHRDLHSNSILVHKDTIKLADFGLSKRIDESSNIQSKIFGMSDVYSIGVLLWEISSGRPPFCNEPYDVGLAMEILHGLREKPIPNTPDDYTKLYTDCWNNEPDNRPTINQVVAKLHVQLSSEQQNVVETPSNNLLHEEMSKLIQNFNNMNTKEIQISISSEKNIDIIVNEIILLLDNVEMDDRKHKIINYLNNHNIILQEIYRNCYYSGIGTNIDKQKAFRLYQKSANSENTPGMYFLGICYYYGIGTNAYKQKALELFQKVANLGHYMAQCHLATIRLIEEIMKYSLNIIKFKTLLGNIKCN
ncbi:kinase-like domain-containing protein [Rhizophagus irregularis DAOM 181602=DAOM 197198]|nr:kinase-like domain-containing protein [Rhizophagus irregularis DAOM 181602=DAOM 197198]